LLVQPFNRAVGFVVCCHPDSPIDHRIDLRADDVVGARTIFGYRIGYVLEAVAHVLEEGQ
jgi:hypothetical protein